MKNKDRYDMNRLSVHIEPQGYLGTQLEIIYDNAIAKSFIGDVEAVKDLLPRAESEE